MLPYALSIGMTYDFFMHHPPKVFPSFYKAYKIVEERNDVEAWRMGIYNRSAVGVAVEHCLAGRKAQSKYIEKPFLMQAEINQKAEVEQLTEAEKQKQVEFLFMQLQVNAFNHKQEQKKKQKEQDGIGA